MEYIYLLHHVRLHNEDEIKLIGAYSSQAEAEAAIERLSQKPGFSTEKPGFQIDRLCINQDQWTEGFTSLTQIWVRPKTPTEREQLVLVRSAHMTEDIYELLDVDPDQEHIPLEFPLGSCVTAKRLVKDGQEVWVADALCVP